MAAEKQKEQECTCGSCIDGWLSPRMKERLEGEADFLHFASSALVEDVAHDIPADQPIPEWCVAADIALQYIPTNLKDKMTPFFYRGYMLVLETIAQILLLEADPKEASIPTLATVSERLAEMREQASGLDERFADADAESDGKKKPAAFCDDSKAIAHYLSSGGKVEYALDALLDRAEEKSPVGSEYGRKSEVRAEEADFEKEVEALPRCVHDLDFALVRRKIGVPERMGPCWFFLSDEEEEDDESEDEEVVYEGVKAAATES